MTWEEHQARAGLRGIEVCDGAVGTVPLALMRTQRMETALEDGRGRVFSHGQCRASGPAGPYVLMCPEVGARAR